MIDDFEELAKIAYKKEELSDFAPLPTKYIYLKLFSLYEQFEKGIYSKDRCIELKNEYRKEYSYLIKKQVQETEAYREYQKNRRQNTELLIKLEKSKDQKNSLNLCLKIIGNCIGDKSFYDRNIQKIEQLDFKDML